MSQISCQRRVFYLKSAIIISIVCGVGKMKGGGGDGLDWKWSNLLCPLACLSLQSAK